MMNETEKLDKFKKAVFGEADKKAEMIVKAAEKERDERLSKARSEAENYLQAQTAQIDKSCEAAAVREISSENLSSKRSVLLRREQIIDRVFDNVRSQLDEFMKTPEYKKLLCERVEECAKLYPNEKGKVMVALRDEKLAADLTAGGQFRTEVSETIEIGGAMIIIEDRNLAVDYTFDYAFSQQRESFAVKAGLNL